MQVRVSPTFQRRVGKIGALLCLFILVSLVLPFLGQPAQAVSVIIITNDSLPDANVGSFYSVTLNATGGMLPYTWFITMGDLPPGLSLNSAAGVISGTPPHEALGSYTFTISIVDMHGNTTSKQLSLTVVGFYTATVTISTSLPQQCQAMVYVDGNTTSYLKGGESLHLPFSLGTTHAIGVDSPVADPENPDHRFKAAEDTFSITEANPNATFQYAAEYLVEYKTEPPSIDGLPSPDWYPEDAMLTASVTGVVDGSPGIQYHFAYWQLPTGDTITYAQLSMAAKFGGEIVAVYDTYYLLTVTSEYGTLQGGGYYKAGTSAAWSVTPTEAKMSGFFGFLLGKFTTDTPNGAEIMTAPKTVTILWQSNYMPPIIIIVGVILLLGAGSYLGYRYATNKATESFINEFVEPEEPIVPEGQIGPCGVPIKCPTPGCGFDDGFCGNPMPCETHRPVSKHSCGASINCSKCGKKIQCTKPCPHKSHEFLLHKPCTARCGCPANKQCTHQCPDDEKHSFPSHKCGVSCVKHTEIKCQSGNCPHKVHTFIKHDCNTSYKCSQCGKTVVCNLPCHGVTPDHSHNCPKNPK
jgi:hypothetical protein